MKRRKTPARVGAKPPRDRRRPSECDYGDVVVYADGRVARVTAFLVGGTFGRWVEAGILAGELFELPDESIRLLDGGG